MNWLLIAEMVLALLEKCVKRDGADAVLERLKVRKSPAIRFALWAGLRESGLHGTELRQAVEVCMENLADETDGELHDLVWSVLMGGDA